MLLQAIESLEESLFYASKCKFVEGEQNAYVELGNTYFDYYLQSSAEEDEKEDASDRSVNEVLASLSRINDIKQKAHSNYLKSLDLALKLGDVGKRGDALYNLGDFHFETGDIATASSYFHKALLDSSSPLSKGESADVGNLANFRDNISSCHT